MKTLSLFLSLPLLMLTLTLSLFQFSYSENCWAEEIQMKVWREYQLTQQSDPVRRKEFESKQMNYQGLTMRYTSEKIGERPEGGYPLYIALHGGGSAPSWLNDSQWNHMQIYYKESFTQGIYVAPRGITDTWDLHFRPESYALYDRLIENMILFEGVNPNKVYILGFSAGGDGVYQIAPRMTDRWAAANMSAGHPNESCCHLSHQIRGEETTVP